MSDPIPAGGDEALLLSVVMGDWMRALQELTASPARAARYREMRSRFAVAVAGLTVTTTRVVEAPVVYGVWLNGHQEPVYIGQTMNASRRLWDLPIGESHHLANTFPPEIWERIVVVRWSDVLARDPDLQKSLASEFGADKAIGLMLEHHLQRDLQPRFNAQKRTRSGGGWRAVNLAQSRAIGARSTAQAARLYRQVFAVWQQLACQETVGKTALAHDFGGVIFPSQLWHAMFQRTDMGHQAPRPLLSEHGQA